MPNLTTSPWQAAVDRISSKTPVGSRLRSAEWAQMPLALRERAQFSSGVENLRVLSAMRDKLTQAAQQLRTEGTLMDKGRFVADLRNMLGAAPGDSGDLTDITSRRRLELIWDFQQQDAHGFASREADLDPDVQDAFPAYRFMRIEARKRPRQDWFARWGVAGAKAGWVGASRATMVALKTSPIWEALSIFGRPWAPFDWGSGMGLEDVDREEAEKLDLLPKDQPPAERIQQHRDEAAAARQRWNDGLQASVKGLDEQALAWLREAFGDQITIEGGSVSWRGQSAAPETVAPQPPASEPTTLPDVDRVTSAAAKATTRAEAHAIVALPAAERGALRINATATAQAQADQAHDFIRSLIHKDVATTDTVKVSLIPANNRGHYVPSTQIAHVRPGAIGNTVHEIAHHIECRDPEIFAECRAFLLSRAKPGEKPQRMSHLTGNYGYASNEIAIEDEWVARGGSVYSGKVYPEHLGATEILTMGLERMYDDPVKFARQDPDYFKFILRVLRPTP